MLEKSEIYELLQVHKKRLDSLIDRWFGDSQISQEDSQISQEDSQISREDAEFLRPIILSRIEEICMDVKLTYLLHGEELTYLLHGDGEQLDRLLDLCKPRRKR